MAHMPHDRTGYPEDRIKVPRDDQRSAADFPFKLATVPQVCGGVSILVLLVTASVLYLDDGPAVTGDLPLIQHDGLPTKVKPVKPGGLEIPFQNFEIWNRLSSSDMETVERLLPPSEKPVARPPDTRRPAEETYDAPARSPFPSKVSPDAHPKEPAIRLPPPVVSQDDAVDPEWLNGTHSEAFPAPVQPSPPSQPPLPPQPASQMTGSWWIQLASVQSGTEAELARLRAKIRDIQDLTFRSVRVDLKDRGGIYTRLQAGPIESAVEARRLCARISGQGQPCLVVPPTR